MKFIFGRDFRIELIQRYCLAVKNTLFIRCHLEIYMWLVKLQVIVLTLPAYIHKGRGWKDMCEKIGANMYILVWRETKKWKLWTFSLKKCISVPPELCFFSRASPMGLLSSWLPSCCRGHPASSQRVPFGSTPSCTDPPLPASDRLRVSLLHPVVLPSLGAVTLLCGHCSLQAWLCPNVLEIRGKEIQSRFSFYVSCTHPFCSHFIGNSLITRPNLSNWEILHLADSHVLRKKGKTRL